MALVAGDVPSLDQLRPSAEPMRLTPQPLAVGWLLFGLLVAVLVAAAVVWLWRRYKTQHAVPLTPRQQACRELDRLLHEGLADRDPKQFYVELTGIVRRYLEETTGIHAQEQTTNEFLAEIARRATFPDDARSRLAEFLAAADLVKFAALAPGREAIDQSIGHARVFLFLIDEGAAA